MRGSGAKKSNFGRVDTVERPEEVLMLERTSGAVAVAFQAWRALSKEKLRG